MRADAAGTLAAARQRLTKDDIEAFLAELDALPTPGGATAVASPPAGQGGAGAAIGGSTGGSAGPAATQHRRTPSEAPAVSETTTAAAAAAAAAATGVRHGSASDAPAAGLENGGLLSRLGKNMTGRVKDMLVRTGSGDTTKVAGPQGESQRWPSAAPTSPDGTELRDRSPSTASMAGVPRNMTWAMFKQSMGPRSRPDSDTNWFPHLPTVPCSLSQMQDAQISGQLMVQPNPVAEWRQGWCLVDCEAFYVWRSVQDTSGWRLILARANVTSQDDVDPERPYCLMMDSRDADAPFLVSFETADNRRMWFDAISRLVAVKQREDARTGSVDSAGAPEPAVPEAVETAPTPETTRRRSVLKGAYKAPVKVFGEALGRNDKSKGLIVDMSMTATDVIRLALAKFQVDDDPHKYRLYMRHADGSELAYEPNTRPMEPAADSREPPSVFVLKYHVPDDAPRLRFEDGMRLLADNATAPASEEKVAEEPQSEHAVDLNDSRIRKYLRESLFGATELPPPLAAPVAAEAQAAEDAEPAAAADAPALLAEPEVAPVMPSLQASPHPAPSASRHVVRMSAFGTATTVVIVPTASAAPAAASEADGEASDSARPRRRALPPTPEVAPAPAAQQFDPSADDETVDTEANPFLI